MAQFTVRRVPEEVHRAVVARAQGSNRSTEAEIREIIKEAVFPKDRLRLGDELAALGKRVGMTDTLLETLLSQREITMPSSMTVVGSR